MILRNRDLNVQKEARATTTTSIPVKRHAARHVTKEEATEQEEELKPKRMCKGTFSSSNLPDFSKALWIDSSKKASSEIQVAAPIGANIRPTQRDDWQPLVNAATETINNEEQPERQEPKKPDKIAEPEVLEFDREQAKELTAVSDYVQDIFRYHKYREHFFTVSDYTKKHLQFTIGIRAQLVNWLVDLQESFELNHEALYLAVKLFDLFMDNVTRIVPSEEFQLVAATALLIAAKFDEREPPLIDDLIYMSDDTFTREQVMAMERELLAIVDFDLGAPLSYRFLRRFARGSKTEMVTLTLARYILELSLMSLRFCRQSESLIAAACLLLARQMMGNADAWNPLMQMCCGYTPVELYPTMCALNRMLMLRKSRYPNLNTVYRKYSSEIFFKVAAVKPLQYVRGKNSVVVVDNPVKPDCDALSD